MGKLIDVVKKNDIKEVQRLLNGEYRNSPLINEDVGEYGYCALHWAVKYGYVKIIDLLLKNGAKVDQPRENGDTPLHMAASYGHVESIQVLLKSGAKVDQPGNGGRTPLFSATVENKVEAIQALLQGGAKVNQPEKDGWTPLHVAAFRGHVEAIQALLTSGAKVDQSRNDGATPLFIAAQEGTVKAIQALLNGGANVHAKTNTGYTSLDVAKSKGHTQVIQLLEAHIEQLKQPKTSSLPNPVLPKSQTPVLKENPKPVSEPKSPSSPVSLTQELGVLKISFMLSYEQLTLGKELGRGSFGVVYQATWQKYMDVAVKQLHVTRFSEETLAEFKHEMEVMAKLRSPHIIQLYGICTAPYCMVMEYMPKGSLYHVLHSKEILPWTQRGPIALDISKGLFYLHHKNILHRDLKSLNVLLDKHMNAKLSDFGLAKVKAESGSQSNNGVAGTLLWMAPELFKRKAQCTKQSDVYSLGMTLWELASRELPFKDATNQAIAKQWISEGERDDIPKDTPSKLSKMITWCWDGDAAKRPTADQVVEGLKEVINVNDNSDTLGSQPKYFDNLSEFNRSFSQK